MTKEEALKVFRSYKIWDLMDNFTTDELQEMIDAIVSTPSLPSNLDEAAENRVTENGRFKITPFEKMRIEDIMFGAEWMAGQGVTIEGEVMKDINNNLCVTTKGFSGKEAKFGDKVVVQIRKK